MDANLAMIYLCSVGDTDYMREGGLKEDGIWYAKGYHSDDWEYIGNDSALDLQFYQSKVGVLH